MLIFVLTLLPTLSVLYYLKESYLAARNAAQFRKLNPGMKVYSQFIGWDSMAVRLGLVPKFLLSFPEDWAWETKFDRFADAPHATIALAIPCGVQVYLGNADFIREVTSRQQSFPKPLHLYSVLDVFGRNVVTTAGEEWKRHRRITGPQFSEKNNLLVHQVTVSTVSNMFVAWDRATVKRGGEDSVETERFTSVDTGHDMTKLALLVISGAGFGLTLGWDGVGEMRGNASNSHALTYKEALEVVVAYLKWYLILPKWAYKLPIGVLRRIDIGFREFRSYLTEFVEEVRETTNSTTPADETTSRSNLLTAIVEASRSEKTTEGKAVLSESEIMGNIFIFLFAGHETTAGTLQYALVLLAAHTEEQEKLHIEVREILGSDGVPKYSDFNKLSCCLAVMNETLRLFPPVLHIPKWTGTETAQLGPYTLPPQTYIGISTAALHNNPAYWGPEAGAFRPARFLESTTKIDRYAFVPFSEGARGCLGKKFSQIEFVCSLAMIAWRYRWRLGEGVKLHEALKSRQILTLRPVHQSLLEFVVRDDLELSS